MPPREKSGEFYLSKERQAMTTIESELDFAEPAEAALVYDDELHAELTSPQSRLGQFGDRLLELVDLAARAVTPFSDDPKKAYPSNYRTITEVAEAQKNPEEASPHFRNHWYVG
jgi:hypothetical protein